MKCPYCGNEISDNATFCGFCGNPIVKSKKKDKAKIIVPLIIIIAIGIAGFFIFKNKTDPNKINEDEVITMTVDELAVILNNEQSVEKWNESIVRVTGSYFAYIDMNTMTMTKYLSGYNESIAIDDNGIIPEDTDPYSDLPLEITGRINLEYNGYFEPIIIVLDGTELTAKNNE